MVVVMTLLALKENKLDAELMLYGRSYKFWRLKRVHHANHSWFLEAKGGAYFKDGTPYDIVDSDIRFERCNCEACRGKMAQDLIGDVQAIAMHNLLDLKKCLV